MPRKGFPVRFLRPTRAMDGAHTRTLERALKVVQTKERLAIALGIALAELDRYMAGEKALPHQVFITALDIVATGKQRRASER